MKDPDLSATEIIEMIVRMKRCTCDQCAAETKELEEYYMKHFGPKDSLEPPPLANI